MRTRLPTLAGLVLVGAVGCASAPQPFDAAVVRPAAAPRPSAVVPVAFQEPAAPAHVDDFVQLAVGRNPRLAKATFAVDAALGKHVQAGLYPNPTLGANWDEIGDRTGPGGILNVPRVTQEIVTGKKLTLSQAVAAKDVDQATLGLLRERYEVIGAVRAAVYDLYALQQRVAVLDELAGLAGEAAKTGKTLLDNKQIARLDLVQLEVELARFRSQAESARKELPAARRRLAAVVGDPRLAVGTITGPFDDFPAYDLDAARETVLATHPEARAARVGVERAQAAVRRAEAEPIPNVTLTAGYVKQFENRSNDFSFGLSAPLPSWDRNQGNIRTARAELGAAIQDVGRVENELAERVATAHRAYAAAVDLAARYKADILPRAVESNKLARAAFDGGQFEYLRVVAAQRAVAEAHLEAVRAQGDAWRAAADLSALLLEEAWPRRP